MDISSDNDLCMYHYIMIMEIFHLYIYIIYDSFQSNFRLLI